MQKELIRITEEEIDDGVKRIKKNNEQTQYSVSEIVFCPNKNGESIKKVAEKTYDELIKMTEKMPPSMAFQILAQQLSQSASATDGGLLGWFTQEKMDKQTSDVVKELKIGCFGKPVSMPNGNYRILCLNDVKEPGKAPYSESSLRVAVLSLPFNRSMPEAEAIRINKRLPTIMESESEQELHDIANDFGYSFNTFVRGFCLLPGTFQESPLNKCMPPVFTGKAIEVYMVVGREHKKDLKGEASRAGVKENLSYKKRAAYAEKIFKNHKNRALIKFYDAS
jgi:peptidyl-prolyl cis-trans isomerase SurA